MSSMEVLPHLFRTEYRRIASVLCRHFGIEQMALAEDIAGDTFLAAAETWGLHGLPANPSAWLFKVAKNKAADHFRRQHIFQNKVSPQLAAEAISSEMAIDLSEKNIEDSQLQMMFALCHPCIPAEAQIGLSLRILCGFGIEEIARAFLTNKETINKRLHRGKEKLRVENVPIELPAAGEIAARLDNVLTTLYLLFNEGYYSAGHDISVRRELCFEASRLTQLLVMNNKTALPPVYALLALMCFHASRFDARVSEAGAIILYADQDESLWNDDLIAQGEAFLNKAASGEKLSKYHLEAGIAYWHTIKTETAEKWENILQLYNRLLQVEYSPVAALNRTYALSKVHGNKLAIPEALKLSLENNHLYHSLLGALYTEEDNAKALFHFEQAVLLARTGNEKDIILKKINLLKKVL